MSGAAPVRVVTVVGARPQFVKAAAVRMAIERANQAAGTTVADEVLVHTGQHYDYEMSQVFFDGLDLPDPGHHLEVGSGTHAVQTAAMLERLEPVLVRESPKVVVVHGDTNSTLAGALAAAKLDVPVAHVEAGLRSGRMDMPEEVNRAVADRLSTLLFCPTDTAVANLDREGISEGVIRCGDVMLEVLRSRLEHVERRSDVLDRYDLQQREYALATIHRANNTDDHDRLHALMIGLERVAAWLPVLVPLHPRTRAALGDHLPNRGVRLIEPVGYDEMLCLERSARVILTDSGGVQKEAFWLGVPCVTLREETEWPETLSDGWNVLAGADPDAIAEAAMRTPPCQAPASSFGDGAAGDRIVAEIVERWGR